MVFYKFLFMYLSGRPKAEARAEMQAKAQASIGALVEMKV